MLTGGQRGSGMVVDNVRGDQSEVEAWNGSSHYSCEDFVTTEGE
jgi:hypothetical protein